jgi:hypothetical protein
MIGLLASLPGAVRVPGQRPDRAGSSGWPGVIELALRGESDLFGVRGRFSVKGGRSSDLVCPRWPNRYVNSTCPVSYGLL